jgi:hypothetical protein
MSVQLDWSGFGHIKTFRNDSLHTPFFAQERQAVNAGATMSWTAVENGVHFAGAANTADFAMLGRERNGVFY